MNDLDKGIAYLCSRPWLLVLVFVAGPILLTLILVLLLGGGR